MDSSTDKRVGQLGIDEVLLPSATGRGAPRLGT